MSESHPVSSRQLALFAAAAGFVAASDQLLWSRVIASANDNRPETQAHALGVFLLGLAMGSFLARPLQARLAMGTLRLAGLLMAVSGAVFFVAMPVGAAAVARDAAAGRMVLLAGAALTAVALGAVLPLLCAVAAALAPPSNTAWARIVLAHLLGAASAPLLTGYVLLDLETLEHAVLVITVAALALAQACWLVAAERPRRAGVTVLALGALLALCTQERLFAPFLTRIHFGPDARDATYQYLAQGRDGIVGAMRDGREYADGVYDGAFSLDAIGNAGQIGRAYFVPALRHPRRVLLIGLGTGAWARIIADTRGVDSLTIIEANPATVDLLWRYPDIAGVLDEPRVRLHFGDARRWLASHRERHFDVIVMNGPWHWRAGATHLLSAEFLGELRAHVDPGGVAYFNTTGSLDVLYTAAGVWRHVIRVSNFAAASDAPLTATREERRAALLTVTGPDSAPRIRGAHAAEALDAILDAASGELAPALRRANDLWNITDDNMASEFKTNGAGIWWRALPARLWRPDRAWPTILF